MYNITGLLKRISLFETLPEDALSSIANIAAPVRAEKGELLFYQGKRAEGFWGLVEGAVKLYKLSASGREQIVAVVEPGEVFAEVALMDGADYPVYAEALEESLLLFFNAAGFRDLVRKSPEVALSMILEMSAKLRHLAGLVEMLSLKEVPSRLAQYILQEARGEILVLRVSKGDLARMLGTAPETLSRAFRRLEREGAIRVKGSMIRILSRDELERIASSF